MQNNFAEKLTSSLNLRISLLFSGTDVFYLITFLISIKYISANQDKTLNCFSLVSIHLCAICTLHLS